MAGNGKAVHVSITFRNTEGTEPIKNYASEKIKNCAQKFVHHDTDVHLVLTVEKNRHIAEASFHTDGHDFAGREESDNLYSSIDSLADSLSNQLRKHKEKLKNHH
jgi:putative sigma-54 modulation protein